MIMKRSTGQKEKIFLFLCLLTFNVNFVKSTSGESDFYKAFRRREIVNFRNFKSIRPFLINRPMATLVSSIKESFSSDDEEDGNAPGKNKMWPPFPFNLIGKKDRHNTYDELDSSPQTGALVAAFVKKECRVKTRQVQYLCRELWFHFSPVTPPLCLLAIIPSKMNLAERQIRLPLFSNQFVRNFVLCSLASTIVSWGNAELNRKRALSPLPLSEQYRDTRRAILPPFLPDEVEIPTDLEITEVDPSSAVETEDDLEINEEEIKQFSHTIRQHIKQFRQSVPGQSIAKNLQMKLARQQSQAKEDKREKIYNELVELQSLKKKSKIRRQKRKKSPEDQNEELGYALITGASRGIGRALAIELARYEIPLILVARDEEKLLKLAEDIEQCYGVNCCVLSADLSEDGVAGKIYNTTSAAGLKVDILVNNAGIASAGEFVDMNEASLQKMIKLNTVTPSLLCNLYGRDMKSRRRGRMLLVSSMFGAVSAGPTVAAYAATKAFEKSLGLSIGKELELYGVGVTCLIPGAVGDSSFRKRSGTGEALCWKIPFYPKTCKDVASEGVRGLLEGDTKVIPGLINRLYLKMLKPILPERGMAFITEASINPLSYWLEPKWSKPSSDIEKEQTTEIYPFRDSKQSYTKTRRPAILTIPTLQKQEFLNSSEVIDHLQGNETIANETIVVQAENLDDPSITM